MKIGIYGQFYHENSETYIKAILEALHAKHLNLVFEENFLKILLKNKIVGDVLENASTFAEIDSSYDLFFSIGGDGTILKAVTFVRDTGVPIVGINTGRLGFLATIQKENISENISEIIKGNYQISERSLLSITSQANNGDIHPLNFALNEIAVNRSNTTSMIKVDTYVNDEYLTSYWSDGLIVSTPTGSTGYSLSCGGPVIDPVAQSIVLTPIAPHNLNARPLVIPDNSKIRLKVSGREPSYLVALDSRLATMENDTSISIQKSDFTIRLVQLQEDSFIKTLRKKLLWGEDKRN